MKFSDFFPALRDGIIRSLRGSRLHVWLTYRSHANREGLAWPSNELLRQETGYSLRVVKAEKAWLIEKKWLKQTGQFRARVRVYLVQVPESVLVQKRDQDDGGVPVTLTTVLVQKGDQDPGHALAPRSRTVEDVHREDCTIERLWDFFVEATHRRRGETLTPLCRQIGQARLQETVAMCGGDVSKATRVVRLAIEAMQEGGNYWEIAFSSPAVFQRWLNNAVSPADLAGILGARTIDQPSPEGSQ